MSVSQGITCPGETKPLSYSFRCGKMLRICTASWGSWRAGRRTSRKRTRSWGREDSRRARFVSAVYFRPSQEQVMYWMILMCQHLVCLCLSEAAPTCAQQRLQNKDEGKEEEEEDKASRQWRREGRRVQARFKDKSIWLSIMGQVWCGIWLRSYKIHLAWSVTSLSRWLKMHVSVLAGEGSVGVG